MPTPRLEWTKSAHGPGEHGRIAGTLIFAVYYSGTRTRGSPPYVISTTLPGLAPQQKVQYDTADEAKARCERILGRWLETHGLTWKGKP